MAGEGRSWAGLLLELGGLATDAQSLFLQLNGALDAVASRSEDLAGRLTSLSRRAASLDVQRSCAAKPTLLPKRQRRPLLGRLAVQGLVEVERDHFGPESRPLWLRKSRAAAEAVGTAGTVGTQTLEETPTHQSSSMSRSCETDEGVCVEEVVSVDVSGRPLHRLASARRSYLHSAASDHSSRASATSSAPSTELQVQPTKPTRRPKNRRSSRRNTIAISDVAERDGLSVEEREGARTTAEEAVTEAEESFEKPFPLRRLRRTLSLRLWRLGREAQKASRREDGPRLPLAGPSAVLSLAAHLRSSREAPTPLTPRTFSLHSLREVEEVGEHSYRSGYRIESPVLEALSGRALEPWSEERPTEAALSPASSASCDVEGYFTSFHADAGLPRRPEGTGKAQLPKAPKALRESSSPADSGHSPDLAADPIPQGHEIDSWLLAKFAKELTCGKEE